MFQKKSFRILLMVNALGLSVLFPQLTYADRDQSQHQAVSKSAGKSAGWDTVNRLREGNERFVAGHAQHPLQDSATREGLVAGQKPHTIVVSCSDSRVPPEVLFDQGLGEVFVIRLAGNVPSTEGIASIEYAVEHLGTPLLLVMGHESCGAVKAAMTTKEGTSAGSKSLDALVAEIRPSIKKHLPLKAEDKIYKDAVKSNVNHTAQELVKQSKIIREAIEKGHLTLASGIYSLKTGRVEFWDVGAPVNTYLHR